MTEEPNDECVCSHLRSMHNGACTVASVPAMGQCDCVGFRKRESAVVVVPPLTAPVTKNRRGKSK